MRHRFSFAREGFWVAVLSLMATTPVAAADATHSGAGQIFDSAYVLQIIGSLILVLALIFVLLFYLKKLNGGVLNSGALIRVLASVKIGARERVVLIEAGGQQLLLGVAAGGVRTLHTFDTPLTDVTAGDTETSDFSSILRRAAGKGVGR